MSETHTASLALVTSVVPLLHQASCVAIGGRAVLIEGEPGAGKSSLALALIDRGATLVGDDGVQLTAKGDHLWASPVPAIEGRLEIRNIGLVSLPTTSAPVAIVLRLSKEAPRYVEQAGQCQRAGVTLPELALWPDSPVLALRAEWALKTYGVNSSEG